MSTRCNIHFAQNGETKANIYRHCDGYPEGPSGVLADLEKFFDAVEAQTNDSRFDHPTYLAAKFVVWQASQNCRTPDKPLNFISLGIVNNDAEDGQYTYTVHCDDYGRPTVTYSD
jgi:hypothetical protein